jgi:hypothetical protein
MSFRERKTDHKDAYSSDDEPRPAPKRVKGKEARHIRERVKSFCAKESEAWKMIVGRFGSGIRHRELCSLAISLSSRYGVTPISRDEKRNADVTVKWFQDNIDVIRPILTHFQLLDDDEQPIDSEREAGERGNFRARE